MINKYFAGVLSILLFGLTLNTAHAEKVGEGLYLEGGGIFSELEDADFDFEPDVGPGADFENEYDQGSGGYLILGRDPKGPWRQELELKLIKNDLDSSTLTNGAPSNMGDDIENTSLMLNIWRDFNHEGRVKPYIGGGIGYTQIDTNSDEDEVPGFQLGTGLGIGLTDRLSVNVGYRYFKTTGLHLNNGDLEGKYGGHLAQVGLRYNFFAPEPPPDTDGDGVIDDLDECKGTPSGVKVDSKGCPVDSDGDNVTDDKDKCPNTPKGTPVDEKGCPKDSDGDKVHDGIDKCPNTPAGEQVDETGCPLKKPEPPAEDIVLQGVKFEFDKAVLTPNAKIILDDVANVLSTAESVRAEVQGHTDSKGPEAYNQKLSQRRADSVKKYLVDKGIDGGRLETKGFGESDPIADNGTSEGRAKNRRVELKVLD